MLHSFFWVERRDNLRDPFLEKVDKSRVMFAVIFSFLTRARADAVGNSGVGDLVSNAKGCRCISVWLQCHLNAVAPVSCMTFRRWPEECVSKPPLINRGRSSLYAKIHVLYLFSQVDDFSPPSKAAIKCKLSARITGAYPFVARYGS